MEIQIPKDQSDKIMQMVMAVTEVFPEHTHDLLMITRAARNGISLEIQPLTFNRSRQQEKYYRKWAAEFGKFTGNTPNEIHEYMLYECYGGEVVKTKLGIRTRPHKRSADASRADYSELIETLIRIAAEHEFVVPPAIRRMDNS